MCTKTILTTGLLAISGLAQSQHLNHQLLHRLNIRAVTTPTPSPNCLTTDTGCTALYELVQRCWDTGVPSGELDPNNGHVSETFRTCICGDQKTNDDQSWLVCVQCFLNERVIERWQIAWENQDLIGFCATPDPNAYLWLTNFVNFTLKAYPNAFSLQQNDSPPPRLTGRLTVVSTLAPKYSPDPSANSIPSGFTFVITSTIDGSPPPPPLANATSASTGDTAAAASTTADSFTAAGTIAVSAAATTTTAAPTTYPSAGATSSTTSPAAASPPPSSITTSSGAGGSGGRGGGDGDNGVLTVLYYRYGPTSMYVVRPAAEVLAPATAGTGPSALPPSVTTLGPPARAAETGQQSVTTGMYVENGRTVLIVGPAAAAAMETGTMAGAVETGTGRSSEAQMERETPSVVGVLGLTLGLLIGAAVVGEVRLV